MTLDWTWISVGVGLLLIGGLSGFLPPLVAGGLLLAISLGRACLQAHRASVRPRFDGPVARTGVALLTLVQGPLRSFRRFLGVFRPGTSTTPPSELDSPPAETREPLPWYHRSLPFPSRGASRAYWSESGAHREDWLAAFESAARDEGLPVVEGRSEEPWDLCLGSPRSAHFRVTTVTEYHDSQRTLTRIRWRYHSTWAGIVMGGIALLSMLVILLAFDSGWSRLAVIAIGLIALANAKLTRELPASSSRVDALVQSTSRQLDLSPVPR